MRGVGIPELSAILVKRTDNVCFYERWDNVYEVFRPNIQTKGSKIFDTYFDDDTETYPGNEDFGKTAFCFSQKKYADECYNKLTKKFR